MAESKKVQITFERDGYRDALYFDYDAYHSGQITPEMIAAEEDARFENWQYMLAHPPPPPPEPTEEELLLAMEQALYDLEMQLLVLQGGL